MTITIPPEALEAAYRAFLDTDAIRGSSFEDCTRAACLAMLEAWPEITLHRADINTPQSYLILPLTEKPNDH